MSEVFQKCSSLLTLGQEALPWYVHQVRERDSSASDAGVSQNILETVGHIDF
jgi:hypothetical protein